MVTFATAPLVLSVALVALGVLYVLLPVALATYRRVRGPRAVTCPETGALEVVEVDAARAAATALFGEEEVDVTSCSRWPERKGCDQACSRQLREVGPSGAGAVSIGSTLPPD